MQLSHLISRLKLQATGLNTPNHDPNLKPAAVLVPIVENQQNILEVWLTQRPDTLRLHPSQISFPGGKLEVADNSLYACATRETYEEIGIKSQVWQAVSQLSKHQTLSGYEITPYVSYARYTADNKNMQLTLNPIEVTEVIKLPLNFLLTQAKLTAQQYQINQQPRLIWHFYYKDKLIWGATAAILAELKQRLI
ncbi:NUDIX hydrolase [Catenovulum adriaticum]|uniref:CoA pyrophosphatase n=1 Tax=Catenovulum adriaticum TaxID=2984846 RepID=A0ABY7AK00_9ALTE|nr:CoA pyrophosphatase [Catenovulum sp. TS8]WAJ69072.1 CoA pyrophosphatase [Catenovulum sp. TS8]